MISDRKVSILLANLTGGGAERVCIYLANEFVARGLNVDLVLIQPVGALFPLVDPRVRVVDLGVPRVRNVPAPLSRYLLRERPVAVLTNMWPLPIAAQIARWRARSHARVVAVEHTTWSRSELYAKWWKRAQIRLSMRLFYSRLDAVVAVSDGAARDLEAVSGLPDGTVRTIHNPIVGATRTPVSAATQPDGWVRGSHKRVLAVGTLKAIKDYPTLLEAFAILIRRMDAKLLILGEGGERPALESLLDVLGLRDVVFMPGFVADTRAYSAAADLFVLSSRGEGFGNVVVEALEQGNPVVSTDCPSGPREILEDGKYGTLVPVGHVDALAKAMHEALSRDHDHEALKRRAQDFSVNKAADAYLDLLLPGWRTWGTA